MAIQVVGRNDFGSLLGTSLGKGLGELATQKLVEMQKRKGLEALGLSKDKAKGLAKLPGKTGEIAAQQELAGIRQREGREQGMQALASMFGVTPSTAGQQQVVDGETPVQQTDISPTMKSLGYEPGKVAMQTYAAGDDIGTAIRAGQQAQKIAQREMEQAENRKFKEKQLALSETKTYRDAIDKTAKNAQTDLQALRTQEDLVKSGKLIGPKSLLFLDKVSDMIGLNEIQRSALKNNESVVFEKLSIPFFRSLKETFGARPTQWDAQQIAKGFPSLYQSDKGKLIINDFMTMQKKADIEAQKIKNNLIKQNNGVPPLDLSVQVDDKLESFKENQYKIFRNKMDNHLVTNGPPVSLAEKLGKDATVEGENGVVFVSDGTKWSVLK